MAAVQVMRSMMERLGLAVNEEKSGIRRLAHESVEFLGYTVSGLHCATPERNAASASKRRCSSPRWLLWFCGCRALPPPSANGADTSRPTHRTARHRSLSTVFLGQVLWRNQRFKVTLAQLFDSMKRLKLLVIQEPLYA